MEDALQRIERKIDTMAVELKGELSGLHGEVTGPKGGVTGLKTEMTAVKGALAGVENRLGNVEGGRQATDKRFDEVMAKLDERVQPIEMATRYLATKKTKPR